MNNVCVTSCYELEMLDEHTASLFNLLICNGTPPTSPPHSKYIQIIKKSYHFTFFSSQRLDNFWPYDPTLS